MSINLETRRLSGALGAEVLGMDVRKLDDATFSAIHAAFLDHHVLLFRGQDLTPEDEIAFGERFGELLIHPIVPHIEGYPPIIQIMNLGKRRTLTEIWHSDVSFEARPPKASALYALEIPEVGGDTMFANQHLAYERLSPGMQKLLGGLEAVHSGGGLATAFKDQKERADWALQGQRHPVIRTHPETGRKALYVSRAFVIGLADMTPMESEPLLSFLYEQATRPDLSMRHAWQEGDLVIWDNRSVQHYAVHDYGKAVRTLHRVTVIGDVPV